MMPIHEIQERIKAAPLWQYEDQTIKRQFTFPDFSRSMEFVNKVASLAEKADHHPNIQINYDKVL